MKTYVEAWAEAIGHEVDADGSPTVDGLCGTLRAAVFQAGFVTLSRLTGGLREAYGPLGVSDAALAGPTAEALRILVLTGDVDVFSTAAGRAYASTPPRIASWGADRCAVLGAVDCDLGAAGVRRVPASSVAALAAADVPLADELGHPDWIVRLVGLGGADPGDGDVAALAAFAAGVAAGGDRYVDDPFNPAAVLSGRRDFFGDPRQAPDGRWCRMGARGAFPAVVSDAHRSRRVVMHVDDAGARIWTPPDPDVWKWIVVATTVCQGDDVMRYAPATGVLRFLTPPPRQLERAARIAGTRDSAWGWRIDEDAFRIVEALIRRRTDCVASASGI